MTSVLRLLRRRIDFSQRQFQKLKGRQINSHSIREEISNLVQDYFRDFRSTFKLRTDSEEMFKTIDSLMQDLLRCTHCRSLGSVYFKILKKLNALFSEAEVQSISLGGLNPGDATIDKCDELIVETLIKVAPAAAKSYQQGLDDLMIQKKQSWRGTIVEFRESLRETLDTLAPDQEVQGERGFKLEPETNGPTMKQKVSYVLSQRKMTKAQIRTSSNLIDVVEDRFGHFVRSVYTRSSVAVHTTAIKAEAVRIRANVKLALSELLELKM